MDTPAPTTRQPRITANFTLTALGLALMFGGMRPVVAQTSGPWPPSLGAYFWRGYDHSGNGDTSDFSWDGPWVGGRWYAEGDEGCMEGCQPPTFYQLPPEDGDALFFRHLFLDPEVATPPFNISVGSHSLSNSDVSFEIYANFSGGSFNVRNIGISTIGFDEDFPGSFPVLFNGTSLKANQVFSARAYHDTLTFSGATIESPEIHLSGEYSTVPGTSPPPDGTPLTWVIGGSQVKGGVVQVSANGSAADTRVNFSESSLSGFGLEVGIGEGDGEAQLNLMNLSEATPSQFLIVGKTGKGALKLESESSLLALQAYGIVGADAPGFLHVADNSTVRLDKIEIGLRAEGLVALDTGGKLFTNEAFLGRIIGFDGTVNIESQGRWETGSATIGEDGTSHIYVRNGGTLKVSDTAVLGKNEGSQGYIHLIGSEAQLELDEGAILKIGEHGTGVLDLSEGARFTSQGTTALAEVVGGTGIVTVDGQDSQLTVNGNFNVGDRGTGEVSIRNGGKLHVNGLGVLGNYEDSKGVLNLVGAESQLTFGTGGSLIIGDEGAGELHLSEGATFESQGAVDLGFVDGSSSTVTVDGASGPSQWKVNGAINIGVNGMGRVELRNGGLLETVDSNIVLGSESRGDGALVIDGEGSGLLGSGTLSVAREGKGQLEILGGAGLELSNRAAKLTVGDAETSEGIITVKGQNVQKSSLSTGELVLGRRGKATLDISEGAYVKSSGDTLLAETATATADVFVTGVGSEMHVEGDLIVGKLGAATAVVDRGQLFVTKALTIGDDGPHDSSLEVRGTQGRLEMLAGEGAVTIGRQGGGQLEARDLAQIRLARDVEVATESGSSGILKLTNSAMTVGDLEIGKKGAGELILFDSATLLSDNVKLGGLPGAPSTASAKVNLNNSQWTVQGTLHLGQDSEVKVFDSELVVEEALTIEGSTSRTAKVDVSSDSRLQVLDDIRVGGDEGFGELTVRAIGKLQTFGGKVHTSNPNVESKVTLESFGSWHLQGPLEIGSTGRGEVTLDDAAQVTGATTLQLGSGDGSGFGRLTLTDSDALAQATDVRIFNGFATVSGGSITAQTVALWPSAGSANLLLTGAGSAFDATSLEVGPGAQSFVTIQDGAHGVTRTARVDGTVIVNGGGSLTIGNNGSWAPFGAVQVNPGGTLSGTGRIFGNLIVKKGGTNQFAGGIFRPGNSPGTFTVDGDLTIEDGAALDLEIGGMGTGLHDVVEVLGNVDIQGNVLLRFVDGFAPQAGQQFELMTGASMSVAPDIFVRNLAPGWQYSVTQQAGAWVVNSLSDGVYVTPGDFNYDGVVDAADFTVWRDTLGQEGFDQVADADGDGLVGHGDYDIWRANFGATAGDGALAKTAVAEPASLVSLLAAMAACLAKTRKRS